MNYSAQVVFIVSGDSEVRSSLECVLSARGLHTVSFETAAEYLACATPSVPACLVLDVELPDTGGLDLQQQLMGAGPPIVFVTRHADLACAVRAIKAGALDFLAMPFDPQQLLRAVQAALDICDSARAQHEKLKEIGDRYARLTPRERQVLRRVVSGLLNKQVAAELGISEITVQIHRQRVMRKMRAASFADLVRFAGLLRVPFDDDTFVGAAVPMYYTTPPYQMLQMQR